MASALYSVLIFEIGHLVYVQAGGGGGDTRHAIDKNHAR